MFYRVVIVLIMVVFVNGCGSKKAQNFSVDLEVLSNNDKNEIKLHAYLVNKKKSEEQIYFASPLIQYEISNGGKNIDTIPSTTFDKRNTHNLLMNERYNPDDYKTISLQKGEYTIVAIATFQIANGNEKNETYKIKSSPFLITAES